MQLVRSLPIPGPVEKHGGWYDDFAQSGGKSWTLDSAAGSLIRTSNGIGLEAVSGWTWAGLSHPTRLRNRYTSFEFETVCRGYGSPTASSQLQIVVHYTTNNNRIMLIRLGNNTLIVTRVVGGVYTTLMTVSNVTYTAWAKLGLRNIGASYEVFLDGKRVGSFTEPIHQSISGVCNIGVYDPSINIAKGEFRYIAIRPLGYDRRLIWDSFNRADAASLGTANSGQAWATPSASIYSGQAGSDGTAAVNTDVDAFASDVIVKATITTHRATSNGSGLRLRAASAGSGDRLTLHYESDGTTTNSWTLYRVVSGVWTEIGRYTPSLQPNGRVWPVEVSLAGSAIKVYLDNETTPRISVSEAQWQTGTSHGIRFQTGDSLTRIDNFSVERPI